MTHITNLLKRNIKNSKQKNKILDKENKNMKK